MRDFPIRNIFLPAVLVAGSTFSLLTLPAALNRSPDGLVNSLPVPSQMDQIGLDQFHKSMAIPYLGTVIVLSAGAGIVTAELTRKRGAARQKADTLETASATEQQTGSMLSAMPVIDPACEWPTTGIDETVWPESQPKAFGEAKADLSPTVVVFPGQYQRCRIQVPHLQEQLYAIEFNEQFYRLLSASISKAQALAAVEQMAQEDHAAVLTRMNEGYAVWVLEPQTKLVSVA